MDQGKTIRIALLDDNVLFRKALKLLLATFEGFHVQIETDNVSTLIDKLNDHKAQPDICIMSSDAIMLNNNQALKDIKRTFRKMKVLALVKYYDLFGVYKMLYDGADGYLLKNCQPADLKKTLLTIKNVGKCWDKDILDNWFNTSRTDYNITKSQITFLCYCTSNLTYTEMAHKMGLSPRTIDGFRELLFKKFKVDNRTTLALFAIKNGLIKIE